MLKGTNVGLRPLQSEDVWSLYKWFNDQRVLESLGLRQVMFCVPLEEERRMVEARLNSSADRDFIIIDLQADRPLGWASLSHIDQRNADAELHLVIGEVSEWDNGWDEEAASLLLDHAFYAMNLHRVYARAPDYNERAVSFLTLCGFQKDGLLRDDHYHDGAYRSSYMMSRLRPEGRDTP
jgi:RimJ/RimL family protein N-acetyltransferase